MKVQIHSSHLRGNAPPGYLIARVEITPTVYADAERNPYTNGEWTWLTFHCGDCDAMESEAVLLCGISLLLRPDDNSGVVGEVREILRQVSMLFDFDGGHPAGAT